MKPDLLISEAVVTAVAQLYQKSISIDEVNISVTRKEVEGDFTVTVFPLTKYAGKKPHEVGADLGAFVLANLDFIEKYEVIQGFLNFTLRPAAWIDYLLLEANQPDFGFFPPNGKKVMVEYSSPNTNKPLHLGHIRNILLGWSTSRIMEACGYEVIKSQVINDRGIAICKSMLAWEKFGNGATPESTGKKGDHFVGDYYVAFERAFQAEYKEWQVSDIGQGVFQSLGKPGQDEAAFFSDFKNRYMNEYSLLGMAAREMLLQWEAGDEKTIALWKKMNDWVYSGFNATYDRLGVHFDKTYYESETYLLGKETILKGLADGIFYQKEDKSIWVDLSGSKLEHKVLLRSDGTSVYITQDIGMARLRYETYGCDKVIYVVADEQDNHFNVLFEVLKKLGEPYAGGLFHLSYGMVDLPSGRMKSREGTVVDADDLMDDVIAEARKESIDRGEIADLPKEKQEEIINRVGLAALKYFIIKVNPKKKMIFDPAASVELQGQTATYIQYNYVRTRGVLRKAQSENDLWLSDATIKAKEYTDLQAQERDILVKLYEYPRIVRDAAENYDPSLVGNFCYELSRLYSKFWQDLSVFRADDTARSFRLLLSQSTGDVLEKGMKLLGIEMPERM